MGRKYDKAQVGGHLRALDQQLKIAADKKLTKIHTTTRWLKTLRALIGFLHDKLEDDAPAKHNGTVLEWKVDTAASRVWWDSGLGRIWLERDGTFRPCTKGLGKVGDGGSYKSMQAAEKALLAHLSESLP